MEVSDFVDLQNLVEPFSGAPLITYNRFMVLEFESSVPIYECNTHFVIE